MPSYTHRIGVHWRYRTVSYNQLDRGSSTTQVVKYSGTESHLFLDVEVLY